MAITYKSQGGGVSTETSGAALSPLCPATVDAGDILILHIFWEGTTTAPSPPGAWTILGSSPYVIETTIARHWVYGKIADGTEDGAAIACGSPAVTTQRGARIYSFAGRTDGTITSLVNGFAHLSHATDPAMPTVTTTQAGALAVALVAQNDNNTFGNPTGESGGDWVEALAAEFSANLTPGFSMGICSATPTGNPGTISGGTIATTNDPVGVIGFQIKASSNTTLDVTEAVYVFTTQDAGLQAQRKLDVTQATYSFTPADVTFQITRTIQVDEAVYVFSTEPAGLTVQRKLDVTEAVYTFTGADVTFIKGYNFVVDEAVYSFTESDVTFLIGRVFQVDAASYSFTTQDAAFLRGLIFVVDPASYSFNTSDASILAQRTLSGTEAVYLFTTQDADLEHGIGGGNTNFDVEPAVYSFSGSDVGLIKQSLLNVEPAVYLFTSASVDFSVVVKETITFGSPVESPSLSSEISEVSSHSRISRLRRNSKIENDI